MFANSSSSLFRVSVAVSERSELTTSILPRDQSLLILECKQGSHKGTSIKLGPKRFTKKMISCVICFYFISYLFFCR